MQQIAGDFLKGLMSVQGVGGGGVSFPEGSTFSMSRADTRLVADPEKNFIWSAVQDWFRVLDNQGLPCTRMAWTFAGMEKLWFFSRAGVTLGVMADRSFGEDELAIVLSHFDMLVSSLA
jgi:hypothetical protein